MKLEFPFESFAIPDEYGSNASPLEKTKGINQHSFPITVTQIPKEVQTLALTLIDYDTVPSPYERK